MTTLETLVPELPKLVPLLMVDVKVIAISGLKMVRAHGEIIVLSLMITKNQGRAKAVAKENARLHLGDSERRVPPEIASEGIMYHHNLELLPEEKAQVVKKIDLLAQRS